VDAPRTAEARTGRAALRGAIPRVHAMIVSRVIRSIDRRSNPREI